MKRLVSGIQPTGNLHLGNYLGAIRNWVKIVNDYESYLFLADLHAITVPQDPKELMASARKLTATYIACGLDPSKVAIFNQSYISAHAELGWILGCYTQLGWLNRMTQFKEKSGKHKENASLGLYAYPTLMAADILIYQADIVPVGDDQKQHIELTRDIAECFNRRTETEFFKVPEPMIMGINTRVMSLRDGTKKMSKSDESDYSRINLTDDKDTIYAKFKKAKSDSFPHLSYEPENRPEAANLINIYAELSGQTAAQVVAAFDGQGFSAFKTALGELAVEVLSPIGTEISRMMQDTGYIDSVLKSGSEKAAKTAFATLNQVKDIVGFIRF